MFYKQKSAKAKWTFKLILFLFCLSLPLTHSLGAEEEVPNPTLQLSVQTVQHKSSTQKLLALSFLNAPHWHTYWVNPGDAGLAIKTEFKDASTGKLIPMIELEKPVPKRFIEQGNLWAFGHDGDYSYFYQFPPEWRGSFKAQVTWLICKNICIPGKATFDGNWPADAPIVVMPEILRRPSLTSAQLEAKLESLPKLGNIPSTMSIKLVAQEQGASLPLVLYYEIQGVTKEQWPKDRNFLTPLGTVPFDFRHEELLWDKNNRLIGKTPIGWDGQYQEPEIELPLDGIFKKPFVMNFILYHPVTGETSIISKNIDRFTTQFDHKKYLEALHPIAEQELTKKENEVTPTQSGDVVKSIDDQNIWPFLLLALLGGLILNIMPCVLPVISIKLFGLLKMREDGRKKFMTHNLMYSAGVIFSFLVLAMAIIILKTAGQQVGWGFQLQSPGFVFLMIVALFVFALNLFELFEFRTPGGGFLGQIQLNEGPVGDFLSGVLATILSTPCSAPFLGTALTFAFNSSELIITTIFITIGIGLASPFLLTAFFPSLVEYLPRPGNWMNTVKKYLGLSLIMTCIWLIDVFVALQDGGLPLLKLLTVLTLLFFFFYIRKHTAKSKSLSYVFLFIVLGMSVSFFSKSINSGQASHGSGNATGLLADKQAQGLPWMNWSEDNMNKLKTEGKTVFIDFTAKWCFTCKVNEKLILETDGFKKLVEEKKLALLLADWTRHDPVIGAFLKKNGMVGVPAYFVQKPDGTLINLGETITLEEILSAL